jgi:hypothetical protein
MLIPILMVIGVNEYSRQPSESKPYHQLGIETLNSNTTYCKRHHVAFMKPYFHFSDPVYFGIIDLLKSSGNYAGANIIFLVLLWPLLMYWLLIKVVKGQARTNYLKKNIND